MILPPFFGFATKYDEKFIHHAVHDYLSADIVTYTQPTTKTLVTYLSTDVLCYNSIVPIASKVSYVNTDILSYTIPSVRQPANVSYLGCDVLCYELPPTRPSAVLSISVRDKDSLGVVAWQEPYNGKDAIIDYIIQYKSTGDINWTTYNEGISVDTYDTIPLSNNIAYHFRIAAVNSVGTGDFGISDPITPSGGIDLDCDMIMYSNLDSSDRNFIEVTGCYTPGQIYVTDYVTTGVPDEGAFGSYWYFPGTLINLTAFPHNGDTSYPHMSVTKRCANDWSLINNFTLSLWFKPSTSSINTKQTLLSASSESGSILGNYSSWQIYIDNAKIAFAIGNTNVGLADIVSVDDAVFDNSSFTHLAVCRSNNYITLYINGVEKDENYFDNNIYINSQYLILGAYPYIDQYNFSSLDGWGITTQGFTGGLDEVIVSRSCFYRGNFTPPTLAHSTVFDCVNCTGCPSSYSYTSAIEWSIIDNLFIP